MTDALILWSHALSALLFAALAAVAVRRRGGDLPRWPFVMMLGLTSLWALAVAGVSGADPATRLVDGARNLAMLGMMVAILRARRLPAPAGAGVIYGVVALVVACGTIVQILGLSLRPLEVGEEILSLAALMRMMVDVAALVLVHNLAGAERRGDIALLAAALAASWASDLVLAAAAWLTGVWSPTLQVTRGIVTALAGALIAAAMLRADRRPAAMSRTIAYRALTIVAIGGYFALLAVVTSALSSIGATARLWQTAFVFGSATAVVTVAASPWLRAWAKVKVAKHLYRHRYDYRTEWLRFTATLAAGDGVPLSIRVVKAVADLTDSPAGLLFVRDGAGLGVGAEWNWDDAAHGAAGASLVEHLRSSERIVELDPLRAEGGDPLERGAVPDWMLAETTGWALVPLIHGGDLIGAILLARPPLDRSLDWEDFDLLKVAGRQVASYLAEARALEALAEGQRFDEFNRRFAFIVHDIKNLASGIGLVARNAERHAENPEFRADMIATLNDSATKMTALLTRLSAASRPPAEAATAVPLRDFAERISTARRMAHAIRVGGDADIAALADPVRLEQLIRHLIQNAVEASHAGAPVVVQAEARGDSAVLAIVDTGCGMSAAFVRDQLFRPFVSSKPAGFGIGAFEAKQLAESMGGRIEVTSREGEGSTFRIVLPRAQATTLEKAA